MITAPPAERAEKRFIKTVLKEFTSETPETASSLTKLTVKISAIPTSMMRNCSTKSGKIRSFNSLSVNKRDFLPSVLTFKA